MNIKEDFDKIVAEGKALEERAKAFSGFEKDVSALEDSIFCFRNKYEEDDSVDEDELEELVDELWEQRNEATSWLPSSYQC